ncbi:MAG TPA: hypothetical protein VM942_08895 [Acidimicrobiales bacterium]|nr:hypothetical protein [Acidimicrobiales bacterium]
MEHQAGLAQEEIERNEDLLDLSDGALQSHGECLDRQSLAVAEQR